MISLLFALTGIATIFFNDRIEYPLLLLIPAILIVLYGVMVGLSLIDVYDENKVKKRSETISYMGLFYTLLSLTTMLYKLKVLGGSVPMRFALLIAFTYLIIAITSSMAGLIFHGLIRGIFKNSLSAEIDIFTLHLL